MALTAAAEQFVTPEQVRDPSINNCACITTDTPSDDELDLMIDEASDMHAIVSGFVIAGQRQLIARPCKEYGSDWCCPCCGMDAIPLGDRNPTVDEIKINGDILTSDDYMIHHTWVGPTVVRLDPDHPSRAPRSWPANQRWWLADTEDRTFSILFTEGLATDRILIRDSMFEVICDMVTALTRRSNALEGAVAATMGGVTVTLDPDQVNRLRTGGFGPASSKLMAILAPGARMPSAVYAPELEMGWDLHLQFATV